MIPSQPTVLGPSTRKIYQNTLRYQQQFFRSFTVIERMLKEKKSYREIAKKLKVSYSTVSLYIKDSSHLTTLAQARGENRGGSRKKGAFKMLSCRESREMCQQGVCKWHTYDMDGPYCSHPKSYEVSPGFGCSTNRMIREGLCTGCSDDPSKNKRQLFEPVIHKEKQ